MNTNRDVPVSTLQRLPAYLRVIDALMSHSVFQAPSTLLAERAGVGPAKFRKDMSVMGATGVRGYGYDLTTLREQIRETLGSRSQVGFVIVGMGHLGQALARSSTFGRGGLSLRGLFDVDPHIVGRLVAGHIVEHDHVMPAAVVDRGVSIVVLTTPSEVAQEVADAAVAAGVHEILNFTTTALRVPPCVEVRGVDLGVELQMLAFRARQGPARLAPAPGVVQPPPAKSL
ncbi:redox-sensing transcriptional repressor Rex [Jonesia quinghaiensis]|uniref:redox-sensing transcriptional repressor Rex n=1 Tax=Jonesia quinghaiensis TaxID=262806 RepID=UPI0004029C5E|nr:redox-sensing transcriptional repressor Rex [Jonesia quinghaiensis]